MSARLTYSLNMKGSTLLTLSRPIPAAIRVSWQAELDELPGLAGTKSGLEELLDESINNPYRGRQLAKEALGTLLLFMRPFIADLPSDTALRHLHNNTKTPFAQTIVAVMMQLPKTAPVFSSQFHTCTDAEPMIMQAVRGAVMTVSAEKCSCLPVLAS